MTQTQVSDQRKDYWSAEAYQESAAFVPKLAHKVLQYLNPQPTDRVLDVGCGDGKFTSSFIPHIKSVLGVDASPSMISSAKQHYGIPKADFRVVDCRYLDREQDILNGAWDKVVSNAALHWILKDASTRLGVLEAIHRCLKPNGTFVFEMGGHGNVPEAHSALLAAVIHQGATIQQARAADPWFFPSEAWMRAKLEKIGFRVEKLEVEYRPTRLTADANGGLAGWVRLMGSEILDIVDADRREAAVEEVSQVLETVIMREEDGSKWLGYVRLRGVAVKT
ncbi:S-adenosylmethionine (SAM)-dependent methyltransferase [Histoplasma capsulatum var. duboisii H88]|uniref:S-adenosylmethionine (SAM)-dependent methyltransferase n=1 Tax=Ajellomyces capsulatus (strain H88) TaxID=544711 RepID=A0A8A1LQD5_AJEC8|nr:S-adenosylmethionine (SAM)-dependent methyltransferase [Histoplasma capsulatum var. duboisii H88]